MPSFEAPVPVQTDTLTTNPVPVRMLTVNAVTNGVATPVQMQVISIADQHGVIFEAPYDPSPLLLDIVNILKDIRVMMSKLADMPFTDNQENRGDEPGVIPN